ncbi:hypothetical protein JHK87_001339 [Glycine soja]|nr:hypothetical protein JHK87_001339 [Glycine soja]
MDRYANSVAPPHHHLLTTALRFNLAVKHLPLYALDASEAGLDTVVLSTLVSLMAIAFPLVPLGSIVVSKSREAAKILMKALAREGEGVSVVCVRSMALRIGNPYRLYVRVFLVFHSHCWV